MAAALLAVATTVPLLLGVAGARINTTPSLPYGVYWARTTHVEIGSYVTFCPPSERPEFALAKVRGYLARGTCPGGTAPLLKRVVAKAGDKVAIDQDGVRVNGRFLPHSRPLREDNEKRPMPQLVLAERQLAEAELLTLSDFSDRSFDGRYFGPIPRAWLRDVVQPIVTWTVHH